MYGNKMHENSVAFVIAALFSEKGITTLEYRNCINDVRLRYVNGALCPPLGAEGLHSPRGIL